MEEANMENMKQLIGQLRRGWKLPQDFGPETHLIKNLGLTSLELIGLIFLCQNRFKVSLITTDDVTTRIQTVGQAVNMVRAQQGLPTT